MDAGRPAALLPQADRLRRRRYQDTGQPKTFSATVSVSEDDGPERARRLHRQRPAAAARRERAPARPRLRAGAALHRPVRRVADQGRAVPAGRRDAHQRGRGPVPGRQHRPEDRQAGPVAAGRLRGRLPADGRHGRQRHLGRSRPSARPRCSSPRTGATSGWTSGMPGSVYSLDQGADRQRRAQARDRRTPARARAVGQTWTLDDGTKLEFLGTRPFATLAIRYDPAQTLVLVGAVLRLARADAVAVRPAPPGLVPRPARSAPDAYRRYVVVGRWPAAHRLSGFRRRVHRQLVEGRRRKGRPDGGVVQPADGDRPSWPTWPRWSATPASTRSATAAGSAGRPSRPAVGAAAGRRRRAGRTPTWTPTPPPSASGRAGAGRASWSAGSPSAFNARRPAAAPRRAGHPRHRRRPDALGQHVRVHPLGDLRRRRRSGWACCCAGPRVRHLGPVRRRWRWCCCSARPA